MSDITDFFEVYSKTLRGYISFWKRGRYYYTQIIGLTGPKRCSKKVYDEAFAVYQEQQKVRCNNGTCSS